MKIEEIREAIRAGIQVEYRYHAQERMVERDITRSDVMECIFNGEIIEDYPLDENNTSEKSFPSCLILGYASGNRPLHVVVGMKDWVMIITVYIPDPNKWMPDNKTRR